MTNAQLNSGKARQEADLPAYLKSAKPNPTCNRAPWFKNIAPTYAGIFLSVVFYLQLAAGTLSQAGIGVCILGLIVAGLLCFALYYRTPALLGMQSGQPFYVICTSTFGATGGYLPGFLLGALNLGFFAVVTFAATNFITLGFRSRSNVLFAIIAILWGYTMAFIGIKGIHYVAKVAHFLNWVPLCMVLIVLFANRAGISRYRPPVNHPWTAFAGILEIVVGYFAAAGAAGADFGVNARDRRDVNLGGLVGIVLAIVVVGSAALLSVAGAIGLGASAPPGATSQFEFTTAIFNVGALSRAVFFLFAAALLVPTTFCMFISANSFSTMLPRIPRAASTMVGATIGVLLVITHVAGNLLGFFAIVGGSLSPVCGAIAADFLLSRKKWLGPRRGINWAGYVAWAVGCFIGMLGNIPGIPQNWKSADHPAAVYSFMVAFVLYCILTWAGARPALFDWKQELEFGKTK
jgi:cytosine permease